MEVGGEFHKILYDKKLVQAANKFAKKYGEKVQVKEIEAGLIAHYQKSPNKPNIQQVWSLKITPEMRRDILKGGVALGGAGLLYSPKERQSQ